MAELPATDKTRFKVDHNAYTVMRMTELPSLRELPRCSIGKHLRGPGIEEQLLTMQRFALRSDQCLYHQPPWKSAAAEAIAIWQEFDPASWRRAAVQARVDQLAHSLRDAVESLIFEPLRLAPENDDLRQGNHRLCALRFDGAEEVLVELIH